MVQDGRCYAFGTGCCSRGLLFSRVPTSHRIGGLEEPRVEPIDADRRNGTVNTTKHHARRGTSSLPVARLSVGETRIKDRITSPTGSENSLSTESMHKVHAPESDCEAGPHAPTDLCASL